MNGLTLGLDIGITSVGYGVINADEGIIVDCGVRLFDEGTAADNEKRRGFRGTRRLIRRKHNRLEDMKKLLKEEGFLSDSYRPMNDVYGIRVKGLNEKLSNDELCASLLHLTKHRGSSFEMEDDDTSGETKKVLSANAALLAQGKYVCEVQLERLKEHNQVRGNENNFRTEDYVKEAKEILDHQDISGEVKEKIITIISRKRAYYEGPGSEKSPTPYGRYIEEDGEIKYYDLIEKMRGKCSIYPEELRAPKQSYSACLFNMLNDLNNLKVGDRKLSIEEKEALIAMVDDNKSITLPRIAKLVDCSEDEISGYRIDKNSKPLFTAFDGYKTIKKVFKEYNVTLTSVDAVLVDSITEILAQKKGVEERIADLEKLSIDNSELIEAIAKINTITGFHSLSLLAIRELNDLMLTSEYNQMQLIQQNEKFKNNRKNYAGKKNIEFDDDIIMSPVAKRAQRETFKVINALRKKYGEFDAIVVETTRDKNGKEQKKRISDKQKALENLNKDVDQLLYDRGYNPAKINAKTKQKIRLYLEQDCKSAYTLQTMDLTRIIEDEKYTEIDHIIPISISLDDSQSNKVLTLSSENQKKSNKTPIGAWDNNLFEELFTKFGYARCTKEMFVSYVLNNKKLSKKKKDNLLNNKDINKYSVIKEFIARNLVDTSYANRIVFNTLSDYFKDNGISTKVFTVRGAITDKFRKQIKLEKDREENYLHHAIDGLIVASVKRMNLLNTYLYRFPIDHFYDEETGEVLDISDSEEYLDPNYILFINRIKDTYNENTAYYRGLKAREDMSNPIVKISHKIDTKANRQIADQTIYSTRKRGEEEKLIEKYKDIYASKFDKLTNDIINGNEEKYLMAQHDPQTFSLIRDIILNHFETYKKSKDYYVVDKKGKYQLKGENPLKLYFDEFGPVHKYSKKGNGPAIKEMKFESENLSNHLDISSNYNTTDKRVIMKQISPYRTDFYVNEDGTYKFVTVRYKDVRFVKSINKMKIDSDWYDEQKKMKEIDDKYVFVCSLHHDEIIGLVFKDGSKYCFLDEVDGKQVDRIHNGKTPELLKFVATNNDKTGIVELKPIHTHGSKRIMLSIGKKIIKIQKYSTDVLGNLYEVKDNVLKLEF